MAKVPAGEWVPHVEAFVDVSRSPAQHSAGVDALAALVNKDKLTLFDLVSKMDMYLTTTDHIVRSRGILLLGQIMSHISFKWLDVNAITTLSDFFISRLSDWQALRGALVGCLALLHRKSSVGTIMVADVKRLVEAFIADVQVQSLAAADRKMCFEIFSWILDHYPEAVKTMDDELLYWICQSIDEEKDPECLKLSFHVVEVVMKLFPDPSGFADQFASDLFEILSKYFPVYFTHGAGDNLGVTRDELSRALMHAFCASPYFEPFAIPLLLDKLSSSLPLAKLDSLKYLDNCIHCYGADRMVTHASAIWFKLKEVLLSLSSDQLLSSGSPKDAENNKNQIKSEAEHCLKTAVTYIHSPDRDIFINLILLDEDIVNNIHSVTTEEKSIDSSLQALGSVVSILAGSSTYLCTRVFQAHFKRLVDILGNSAGFDSQHLSIANGSSPAAINYGALYLSVQMLSSCREVAVASREGVPAEESWWLILEEKLDQIIHLFGKLLTIDCQPTQSAVRKECVSCAVKGLLILATIPEQCSLLLENAYEDILQMLTLVITSKYENAHFWRLSLKTLTSIGSSAVELHASKREMVYNRIVVDKIICLAESCDASMPLNLRLEACFEVGTASVNYMLRVARSLEETVIRNISQACIESPCCLLISCKLHFISNQTNVLLILQVNGSIECADYVACLIDCYSSRLLPWFFTSGGLNELALSFALRLWDEIGDLVTLDRIISEGLLESLMMGMKLLVGVCTEEQQSLIVQKACGIVSSMLSLPVKALTHHLLSVDELVPAHSVQDTALVCMLSSVIVGLWPQTPVPEMMMMINLFSVFLLNGHIPAAHALASIFNKYLQNSEFSHEIKLDKILDVILGGCFSIVLPSSNLKMSRSSAATSDNADFSDSLPGSIGSKIDILCGLAWIGKGLLMRGDEKVKEISMFLLKCLSSEASLASAAADAFHVMMGDSEVCLNKKFHARIKFLYKQRFFSILMPIFLSKIKETSELTTKLVIYRAFGHIISNAPVSAVITEAHQILLVMVDILAKLSVDNQDKDLVYSLLLVLSGMLMDEKGKECIVENIRIIISVLAQLVSYPHMMVVRETALQCFVAMSSFPHSKVYRMRPQVLQAAIKALDDKKRAVRQEAVRCRQTWYENYILFLGVLVLFCGNMNHLM
ncbi:MMS19 nucleotide excision repair protein homolog isoform X1 [Triticum aestivum]|nr:MMS19 nucleotide excision repair protein homolog isoform X1 [Triticum aestivum]